MSKGRVAIAVRARRIAVAIAAPLALAAFCPAVASAADGVLDSRFSGNGLDTIEGGATNNRVNDAAALSDGRMALVGEFPAGNIALLLPNGAPDTSFDGDGFATVPSMTTPLDVAVQADDKIVVSGNTLASPAKGAVARFTTAGVPDPAFAAGTTKPVDLHLSTTQPETSSDVTVAPSGKIVLVGYLTAAKDDFAVAQMSSGGTLESAFAGDGVANFDLNPTTGSQPNIPNAVEVQSDGKIVVAGRADVTAVEDSVGGQTSEAVEEAFAVIRVTTTGVLDSTFASGTGKSYPNVVTGTVECDRFINISGQHPSCSKELESAEDLEIDESGPSRTITVGGFTDTNTDPTGVNGDPLTTDQELDFAMVRLTDVGGLDGTFGGGDGKLTTAVATDQPGDGADADELRAIQLQADGRILAAGRSERGANGFDFGVVRYNSDGGLDANFDGAPQGGNGRGFYIAKNPASADEELNAMALLPNGSVLIAGDGEGSYAPLAVFKTDGTPPNTVITAGPSEGSTTTDNTPTFTFFPGVTEPGATFECRYAGTHTLFVPCSSPYTKALTNGAKTFEVRAIDTAANVDSTPDVRHFTVNASPPDTSLTNPGTTPGAFTADTTPTFNFTSTPGGGTFECALLPGHGLTLFEDADFGSCSGSGTHTASAPADGEYTFAARASDVSGTDPSPATFELEVDTDAPDGVIVQAPSGAITDHTPDFEVSTDEPADIAEGEFNMTCELTGALPQSTSCDATPFSFAQSLPDGAYTFTLQVSDLLGRQDSTPATAGFTVTTPAPPPPSGGGSTPGTTGTQPKAKKCKKPKKRAASAKKKCRKKK